MKPELDSAVLLTREALIKAQGSDPSLAKFWANVVEKSKCSKKQPFFVENGVLMRQWVDPSCGAGSDQRIILQ